MDTRPDAKRQIRLLGLRTIEAINYWSRRPVTRLDLGIGAFEEISSAEVPGLTDRLVAALPGLVEHRCSVGRPGGFVRRLREGTYAPHVIEHVALELQSMAGHDVGFGRARGGERRAEYIVVFEHLHPEVGLRAAAHALAIVQSAFAGEAPSVGHGLAELRALARRPSRPANRPDVACGITGRSVRVEAGLLLQRLSREREVVEVSPAYLLNAGVPYGSSRAAVILDVEPDDLPGNFREPERAARLVSILADAVVPGGVVIAPAGAPEVHEHVRKAGRSLALFQDRPVEAGSPGQREPIATAVDDRIVLNGNSRARVIGRLTGALPASVEVAVSLAAHLLENADRGIPNGR